nr:MAG TPA: hypothetical protein [Caudoviricetes sp.]
MNIPLLITTTLSLSMILESGFGKNFIKGC